MNVYSQLCVDHDESPIWSVHIHPDGTRLATAGGDKKAKIWKMSLVAKEEAPDDNGVQGALLATLDHDQVVNSVRWSPNGHYLATACDDYNVRIYELQPSLSHRSTEGRNIENWALRWTLPHKADVTDIGWSPENKMIASCCVNTTVNIWEIPPASSASSSSSTLRSEPRNIKTLECHKGVVKGICWDPLGRYLASQGDDKKLYVWRTTDFSRCGRVSNVFKNSNATVLFRRLSWSPDGYSILCASGMKDTRHCAPLIKRGEWISWREVFGHKAPVVCCQWCPKIFRSEQNEPYMMFALGAQDGQISIWRTDKPRASYIITDIFEGAVMDISWSANASCLIACSDCGELMVTKFKEPFIGRSIPEEEMKSKLRNLYGESDMIVGDPAQFDMEERYRQLFVVPKESPQQLKSKNVQGPFEEEELTDSHEGEGIIATSDSEAMPVSTPSSISTLASVPASSITTPQSDTSVLPVPEETQPKQTVTVLPDGKKRVIPQFKGKIGAPVSGAFASPPIVLLQGVAQPTVTASSTTTTNMTTSKIHAPTPTTSRTTTITATTTPASEPNNNKKRKRLIESDDDDTPARRKQKTGDVSTITNSDSQPSLPASSQLFSPVISSVPSTPSNPQKNFSEVSPVFTFKPKTTENSYLFDPPKVFERISKDVFLTARNQEFSKPMNVDAIWDSRLRATNIICVSDGQERWRDRIRAQVTTICGCNSFIAIGTYSGELHMYSLQGRRILLSPILGSPIVYLGINKSAKISDTKVGRRYLYAITCSAKFCVYNVSSEKHEVIIDTMETISSHLGEGCPIKLDITDNGCFIIATRGDLFAHSPYTRTWHHVFEQRHINSEYFPGLMDTHWADSMIGNLALSPRNLLSASAKNYHPVRDSCALVLSITGGAQFQLISSGNSTSRDRLIESISHLEANLAACTLFQSSSEYIQCAQMYTEKLVAEGLKEKLREFFEFLLGPPYYVENDDDDDDEDEEYEYGTYESGFWSVGTPWNTTIVGIKKRSLLEVLLPILSKNPNLLNIAISFTEGLKQCTSKTPEDISSPSQDL